jgi:hypothetical protein
LPLLWQRIPRRDRSHDATVLDPCESRVDIKSRVGAMK